MSSKRARVASPSPNPGGPPISRSPSPEPTPKALRTSRGLSGTGHPLLCTLPPTCNREPTPIANSKDLELHYATYHAHVCAESGCACVFPDARLLDLHQTECHDPLAAIRKDRGEKIFACHLASCNKLFATPKTRRLHLIQGHGYPKEYFFAVTNKGVGGLLKKWGEGASLVRGEWKKREGNDDDSSDESEPEPTQRQQQQQQEPLHEESDANDDVDALADSMTALNLVPKTVRFGRGGRGGFERGRGTRRGNAPNVNAAATPADDSVMDVEVTPARGRGRGSFFPRGRVVRGGFRGVPRGMRRGRGQL